MKKDVNMFDMNDRVRRFWGLDLPKQEQATLSERYSVYSSKIDQDIKFEKYLNIIKKDEQKLEEDYQKAIKYLKNNILENTIVNRRNILVKENGLYRLMKPTDFLICDSNPKKDLAIKNQFYVAIRDYLRQKEREERAIAKQNSVVERKEESHRYIPDYSISDTIPESAVRFLYEISAGDFRIVKTLARYCSQIIFKPKYNIIPTVLLADKAIHKELIRFFMKLMNNYILNVELPKILTLNELCNIAYANYNNVLALAIVLDGEVPELATQYEIIRRILHGQSVSVNHPYFTGKLFVENKVPFLYITDSHEKYLKMKNIYGAKVIKIPAKRITPLIYDESFDKWFQNDFVKFGARGYSEHSRARIDAPKITEDDVFKTFSKKLCVYDDQFDCPTRELYEVYVEFYKKFYGENALKFRQFRTKFAMFANLEDCRPHHSSGSNPRCFKGISINYEKYGEIFNQNNQGNYKCTKEEFALHLLEMMRNEFPEMDY